MSYLSKQCAMLIIKLLRPIVHNQSVALGALNGEDTVLSTRTKGSCGDKEEVEGRGILGISENMFLETMKFFLGNEEHSEF